MRQFITIVETFQEWPAEIDGCELARRIEAIHHSPADFDEGDIAFNITSFGRYNLKRVPISQLKLDMYTIYDDILADYTRLDPKTAPPIVIDPTHNLILDGNHRANAAAKRGETEILAYVGDPSTYAPPEEDEDEDEDDEGLFENAIMRSITPEMVIQYMRDPAHRDVNACYVEQTEMAEAGDLTIPDLDKWIIDMVPEVVQKIEASLSEGKMYRGLGGAVQTPVGIHWTTEKHIAKQFADGGPILEASIDEGAIDWLGTIARRIFWDNHDESELTLIRGSTIQLTNGSVVKA